MNFFFFEARLPQSCGQQIKLFEEKHKLPGELKLPEVHFIYLFVPFTAPLKLVL